MSEAGGSLVSLSAPVCRGAWYQPSAKAFYHTQLISYVEMRAKDRPVIL